MNILLPFAVFWGVLALVVLFLIFYRRSVSSREDDSIHLEGGVPTEQVALAHRLEMIDKWGKMLTVVVAVYGLALLAIYLYQQYQAQSVVPG